jgi:hypothetical protein
MSGGYRTGADFWRDTVARYDMAEARIIGESYLDTQLAHEQLREEHGFCRELFMAMYEASAQRIDPSRLVYPYALDKANERMETTFYHENRRLNEQCTHAIDEAIEACRFEPEHYNLDIAAMKVISTFGFERVNMVLAHHLCRHEHDGRYSSKNIRWANEIDISDQPLGHAYLDTHPVLIGYFTDHVRELYDEAQAERFALPGRPERGTDVKGYEVVRSVSFQDKRGYAIGHSKTAVEPYVCWRFTEHDEGRDFYWGRYFRDGKGVRDSYVARIISHLDYGIAKEVENPLAATEMTTEQNLDMIDGILNNMAVQTAEGSSREKPSVLEQIREAKAKAPEPHKHRGERDKDEPIL